MSKLEYTFEKEVDLKSIPCIREHSFKPYHYISDVLGSEKLSNHFLKYVKSFQNKSNHFFLTANKNKKIVGVCVFLISKWDSELFGFGYGQLKYVFAEGEASSATTIKNEMLAYLIDWCRKKNIKFLHSRVDADDICSIKILKENGFGPVTEIVRHIAFPAQMKVLRRDSSKVALFQSKDMEKIKEIASFVFTDNRFYLDSNFPREKVRMLYESWVENSCKGEVQDKVFVYRSKNKTVGFATCGLRKYDSEMLSKRIGSIDLVGIDPSFQNRGMAVQIVNSVMKWLKENTDVAEAVMAKNNQSMIKILEKFGFSFKNEQIDFHCWIK